MTFDERDHGEPAEVIDVSSMVDVVFILLAFFVMTATLRTFEHGLAMSSSGPVTGLAAQDLPQQVPIELRAVDAGVAITIGQAALAPNDFAAVTDTLTLLDLPDSTVVLRSDPKLTIEQVSQAIEAVLASPMKKLSLARLGERAEREEG